MIKDYIMMKRVTFLLFFSCGFLISIFSQTKLVKYRLPGIDFQQVALFVDTVYVGTPHGICLTSIDSLNIKKEPVEFNGKLFEGQLYLFCEPKYKLISL